MVTKKHRFLAVLAIAAALTGLTSCLKNTTTPQQPYTLVTLVNTAPTSYSADIYLNNKKASDQPYAFGNVAGRSALTPGNLTFDFKKAGSDSLLASTSAFFDTLQYNTIILYGVSPVNVYRIHEDFSNVSQSKTNARFFNSAPGTDNVDFYVGATKVPGAQNFADFTGGGYNSFLILEPGNNTITAKDATTGNTLATLQDANLLQGYAYTVFLVGLKTETGDRKLAIKVVTQ